MFYSFNFNTDNGQTGSVSEQTSAERYGLINWQDRANKRFKCKLPIIYRYLNPENFSDEFTIKEGVAYNYSLNGMYFETKDPIPPDLPVYIQAQDGFLSVPGFDAHEGHHAEVKWCKEKNSDAKTFFSIGVQLYEPLTHSMNA